MTNFLRSILDPRNWLHLVRLVHFYGYSHVSQVRRMERGAGVRMAPNVSLRNGERISIGAGSHVGERCFLWAGDTVGRIFLGERALLAPGVFLTASNYAVPAGQPVIGQPKVERDVVVGADSWLGTNVVVVAGVTIGRGCIVAAGAVVTKDLPEESIAAGVPARVVGRRPALEAT